MAEWQTTIGGSLGRDARQEGVTEGERGRQGGSWRRKRTFDDGLYVLCNARVGAEVCTSGRSGSASNGRGSVNVRRFGRKERSQRAGLVLGNGSWCQQGEEQTEAPGLKARVERIAEQMV